MANMKIEEIEGVGPKLGEKFVDAIGPTDESPRTPQRTMDSLPTISPRSVESGLSTSEQKPKKKLAAKLSGLRLPELSPSMVEPSRLPRLVRCCSRERPMPGSQSQPVTTCIPTTGSRFSIVVLQVEP